MKTSITYRLLLLTAFTFSALFTKAQNKPNILVIFGDDIGIANVSAYSLGVMGYETPNIDRIGNMQSNVCREH